MHAYMIIAHNQFELLEKLIKSLDDERNDIYVHIDAKINDFNFEHFSNITLNSRLFFTEDRVSVTWGDYSQVKTEIILLKKAISCENKNTPYSYFHLLSGVDFPIKSQDYIHSFLIENNGCEFIHFSENSDTSVAESRIKYYHFFRKRRNTFNKILSQALLKIQMLFRVNRIKNSDIAVQKGSNWFSITGNLAHFIVSNLEKYEKYFKYSYCGDEVFIQTMLLNSPYKENLFMPKCNNNHYACLRLIDWKRGNPYIWRSNDYDEIILSDCLFARKFDLNTDSGIVDKILNYINEENDD